uniref:Tetratricopeptide repeat domain 24 n=1 Tax=Myripristis murdjan TaxID=586833 RepID=A0A667ZPA4_9TELE
MSSTVCCTHTAGANMASEAEARRRRRMKAADAPLEVEALTRGGHAALQAGRRRDALSCFKKALKASAELQDSRVSRACSFNLGAAYVEAGRPQRGLDFLRRAQPGPRAHRLADLQFNLAVAHNALGHGRDAATHFLRAAQLYRSQGDGASEGGACMEMSQVHAGLKDWSQAVQGFLRAAESYRVAAMLDCAAVALKEAGSHMVQSDQFSQDDIISVLTECLSLADSVTEPRILGELYLAVGVAYSRLRCFQEAVSCFRQAVLPAARRPPLLAAALHNLGAALNSEGRYRDAVSCCREAARLYGSLGRRGDQARCFSNLALACRRLGEEEAAAESFLHALQAFRDTDDYAGQCQVCEALADSYLQQKKLQKAAELYKQALAALSSCQDCPSAARDRLVDKLTAALQQRLTAGLQRPRPLRPHPPRPRPLSLPSRQPDRGADAPGRDFNQQPLTAGQPEAWQSNREGGGASHQDAAGHYGSAGEGATEQPEYLSMLPGVSSEASLAQEPEAPPPTGLADDNKATPPLARWTSRFCTVM